MGPRLCSLVAPQASNVSGANQDRAGLGNGCGEADPGPRIAGNRPGHAETARRYRLPRKDDRAGRRDGLAVVSPAHDLKIQCLKLALGVRLESDHAIGLSDGHGPWEDGDAGLRRNAENIEGDRPIVSGARDPHRNQRDAGTRNGDLLDVERELKGGRGRRHDHAVGEADAAAVSQVFDHEFHLVLTLGHRQVECRIGRRRLFRTTSTSPAASPP